MKRLIIAVSFFVALAFAGLTGLGKPMDVRADCNDDPGSSDNLWYVSQPVGASHPAVGNAPMTVTISITGGVAYYDSGSLTTTLNWGDGTSSAVVDIPCPDDGTSYWAGQDLSHTYAAPGTYQATWILNSSVIPISPVPAWLFVVQGAPPPPPPTATLPPPPPTATSPSGGPTTQTGPTAGPGTPQPTSAPGEASAVATRGTPSTGTPDATRGPTATQTPGDDDEDEPTETPMAPASGEEGGGGGFVSAPVANPYTPRLARSVREPDEVPWDARNISTSIAVAGLTIWVLFSSVMLNQALQGNREEVDRRTAWLTRPVHGLAGARERVHLNVPGWWATVANALGILLLTGVIYTFAEPGLGFDRQTATLLVSVMLGVGLVSYLTCGVEVLGNRRLAGARSTIRPYLATLVIAVVSVVVTRLFELRPGVVFGFVASTVVIGAIKPTTAQSGRIALAASLTGLVVAVVGWALVGPIRSLESDSWWVSVAESTAVIIFIGGIEGVAFSMIPLSSTDGGKIYRWNRWAWAGVAMLAAFFTWHVLLGTERGYFSGLRPASSIAVIAVFVFYVALTAVVLWYFQFRKKPSTTRGGDD